MAKTVLKKKNKDRFPDFKKYYKVTLVKTAWN